MTPIAFGYAIADGDEVKIVKTRADESEMFADIDSFFDDDMEVSIFFHNGIRFDNNFIIKKLCSGIDLSGFEYAWCMSGSSSYLKTFTFQKSKDGGEEHMYRVVRRNYEKRK